MTNEELFHWGIRKGEERKNHKYVARIKVGDRYRYFYSVKEYEDYRKGESDPNSIQKHFDSKYAVKDAKEREKQADTRSKYSENSHWTEEWGSGTTLHEDYTHTYRKLNTKKGEPKKVRELSVTNNSVIRTKDHKDYFTYSTIMKRNVNTLLHSKSISNKIAAGKQIVKNAPKYVSSLIRSKGKTHEVLYDSNISGAHKSNTVRYERNTVNYYDRQEKKRNRYK